MRAMLFIALCVCIVAVALGAEPVGKMKKGNNPVKPAKTGVDVDLDEKAAVAIAEIVLAKVYGDWVLKEKPWNVAADETSFTIEGTLPKETVGGVALIRIRRTNAEVIEITHGK